MTEDIKEYSTVTFSRKSGGGKRGPSRHPEFKRPEKKQSGISRRNLLIGAGAIVGAGVLAALGVRLANEQEKSKAVGDKLAEYNKKEVELDVFLPRFEQGYSEFAKQAKQAITTRIKDPEIVKSLLVPFEIFEINKGNSVRNGYGVKRRDLEKRRSLEGSSELVLENPNFFFYELSGEGDTAGAFGPWSRTLRLKGNYDPKNLLDNTIITHELIHVAQDNQDRTTIPWGVYEPFHAPLPPGSRQRIIDIYEASAYVEEIEIMNVMTNGQFRELVTAKNEDVTKYRGILNSRAEQDSTVSLLIMVASQYYASPKTTPRGIGADFLEYIRDLHRKAGFEVYTRDAGGYAPVRQ